jgi:hypothetical protein
MFRILLIALALISSPAFAQTKGALETPSKDSYISGKYMFSGWACDAELIEIVIDGGSGLKASYGTTRGDTQSICGDSDNGFGLLYNMSTLGTGEHTAVAFADGLEIGRSTFSVQQLSTGNFLRGAESLAIANNFPKSDQESWLWWTQSAQNFVIANEQAAIDPFTVAGVWVNDGASEFYSVSTERKFPDRLEIYAIGATAFYEGDDVAIGYEGYLRGTDAYIVSALPSDFKQELSIRFVDPLNAIVTVESCYTTAPNLYCKASAGQTVALRKFLGANTGRAAVQDGNPLAPIDETLQVTPFGE